ncbi:hypothetical protein [Streptomyces lydicus]|uniref:hypothetical protein n=1 Tax=Streptomyces lydicus TaxID=47763 RepID=UPI0037B98A1A
MATFPQPVTVDDSRFTKRLVRALQRQIDVCAEMVPGRDSYRLAAAWVYTSALVAWAEDHGLIDGRLRAAAAPARESYYKGGGTAAGWLAFAVADLAVHPSTWCLLDPRYGNPIREGGLPEAACRSLIDWWSQEAPDLAYATESGPATVTGWIPGDLLQLVTDERRLANALCQSPWWLADGILDRTLIPAAREFPDETLRLVDPTCGTGHFLIRAIDALWELYTTGSLAPRQMRMEGVTGWTPVPPAEAARRILAGVDGVELDPITGAVAQLRVTVTVAHLLHSSGPARRPLRLDAIPHNLRPRVVVGDSLLAGKVTAEEYARVRPVQAAIVNLGVSDVPVVSLVPEPEPARPSKPSAPPVLQLTFDSIPA